MKLPLQKHTRSQFVVKEDGGCRGLQRSERHDAAAAASVLYLRMQFAIRLTAF
ncbi:MAG: hypothetical protein U1E10_17595 [Bdellovibrionales bacterium]|nr:hypothetical protein [Bdellovibrionales bacterium]